MFGLATLTETIAQSMSCSIDEYAVENADPPVTVNARLVRVRLTIAKLINLVQIMNSIEMKFEKNRRSKAAMKQAAQLGAAIRPFRDGNENDKAARKKNLPKSSMSARSLAQLALALCCLAIDAVARRTRKRWALDIKRQACRDCNDLAR